jgi:hypothetical protein
MIVPALDPQSGEKTVHLSPPCAHLVWVWRFDESPVTSRRTAA